MPEHAVPADLEILQRVSALETEVILLKAGRRPIVASIDNLKADMDFVKADLQIIKDTLASLVENVTFIVESIPKV